MTDDPIRHPALDDPEFAATGGLLPYNPPTTTTSWQPPAPPPETAGARAVYRGAETAGRVVGFAVALVVVACIGALIIVATWAAIRWML